MSAIADKSKVTKVDLLAISEPPSSQNQTFAVAVAAFEASPDLLVVTDLSGRVTHSNQAWRRILGVKPASLIGKPWSAIVNFLKVSAPDPQAAALHPSSYVIAFNTREKNPKWFGWTKTILETTQTVLWTGREIALDVSVHPSLLQIFFDEIPDSIRLAADSSRQKSPLELDHALASAHGQGSHDAGGHDEEPSRLQSTASIRIEMLGDSSAIPIREVIEHMPGILFELQAKDDGSFKFVYATDNTRKLFQMSPEEVYGCDPSTLFLPRDFPGLLIELFDSAHSLKPVSWEGRVQSQTSSAGHWVQFFATPTRDGHGTIVWYGLMLDIHQQRMAEASLQLERAKAFGAAKMAALGEMTAGVAHEINNPLAVILGKAEQLGEIAASGEAFDPKQVGDSVEKIVKMTNRISKIIRGLRSFARDAENDPFEMRPVSQIIEDSVELCNARFRSANVKLDVAPLPPDLMMECRAVQISQVLLNLLNNSFDAIQNFEQKWVKLRCESAGECVLIHLTDCGQGIPPDIASHIMAPFFTTKPAGKGTGLGLSISRGIIEAHGGRLFVDFEEPHTTFVIELPIRQKAKLPVSPGAAKSRENLTATPPPVIAKKAS